MDLQALIFFIGGFFFCVGVAIVVIVAIVAIVRNRERGGEDVNQRHSNNRTLLMFAAAKNKIPLLRLMLEQPLIELNLARDDGFTALHLAVYCGNGEALKALLKHTSISVNLVRAGSGLTALHMAACQGRGEALKLLLAE